MDFVVKMMFFNGKSRILPRKIRDFFTGNHGNLRLDLRLEDVGRCRLIIYYSFDRMGLNDMLDMEF